jgi:peptide/nickel transport system permease protein
MGRYIASRLGMTVVMAVLATLVIFVIANFVPGDPVLAQLGDIAASNKSVVAEWRAKVWAGSAGVETLLDIPVRPHAWRSRAIHLFATAGSRRHPRVRACHARIGDDRLRIVASVGIPLGIMAAVRRDSWIDNAARAISLIGVSSPTFWFAFIMLAAFYGGLEIAPGPGRLDPTSFAPPTVTGLLLVDTILAGDWETFRTAAAHLILPSIVLAAGTLGLITRTTRASMLESIQQDYVRVARSKGLKTRDIVMRHVFRNAVIPIVTLGGLAYANLLAGAVMTETIFSVARARTLHVPKCGDARFSSDHGHYAGGCHRLFADQSAHRRQLRLPGPAGEAMSVYDTAAITDVSIPVRTRAQRFRRRYGLATIGAVIVVAWLVIAIFAPWLTSYSPDTVDVANRLQPPSWAHWFGTDALGRDVYTRVLFGARVSLATGFVVVLAAGALGTLLGAVAAYARGWVEEAIMRCTDLVLCFPPIILALAIAAALGIGTRNTIIAMLVVWWPKFARLAHSMVIVQRSQEYVEAAMVIGFNPARVLLRHILPNSVGPLIVLVTLDLGNAIITFAGLSFLGLGVLPPTPEWGSMIAEGRELVAQWWVATFPGAAILTVVIGFNFLGDGIRDWLDPKARKR